MLVYAIVGAAFGIAVVFLALHYQKVEMPTGRRVAVYLLWLIGLLFVAFACNWGYASMLEGETQSIAMGFLVFGGIGVILGAIGFRLGAAKQKPKETEDTQAV